MAPWTGEFSQSSTRSRFVRCWMWNLFFTDISWRLEKMGLWGKDNMVVCDGWCWKADKSSPGPQDFRYSIFTSHPSYLHVFLVHSCEGHGVTNLRETNSYTFYIYTYIYITLCLPLFARSSAIFVINQLLCCKSDLQLVLRNLWMFSLISVSSILDTFIISFTCAFSVSLFGWLVGCLLGLFVWLIDLLIDWLIDCLFDC